MALSWVVRASTQSCGAWLPKTGCAAGASCHMGLDLVFDAFPWRSELWLCSLKCHHLFGIFTGSAEPVPDLAVPASVDA